MWGRGVGKTLFDACQKTKAAINHQEKRMRFATVMYFNDLNLQINKFNKCKTILLFRGTYSLQ